MDKKDLKNKHRSQKEALRDLVNKWDPYSLISSGAPEDEFDSEVEQILVGMKNVKTEKEAGKLVSEVFSQTFEPNGFQYEDCRDIANKIFLLWRKNNWL